MLNLFQGTSFHTDNLKKVRDIVPKDGPIAIAVGGMAHGSVSYTKLSL